MQLGMIGLGRIGANIVRRLQRPGYECVVFDRNPGRLCREAVATSRRRPQHDLPGALVYYGGAESESIERAGDVIAIPLVPKPRRGRREGEW